ncbi:MAG: prepilin-type N-terminal cleavage/methylation domain-containing protein [candidate division Zixibacteria bacterium]|nr:prepilin-type N-terminal cleavage/methylation domain-containing protein [candidate division Zixibacteria bacterium]
MRFREQFGFTLVELVIVVVIIGVLATLIVPSFMNATGKVKQSEAQGLLKQIYTLERSFFQENGKYSDSITELGIELMPDRWYEYTIETSGTSFRATATAASPGLDDDPTPDIWKVDGSGEIVCVSNDVND